MMRRRNECFVCLVALMALAFSMIGLAQAQEKTDNIGATVEKSAESLGLSQAALAARLALEGESKRSPLMLLVAADMLDELKSSDRSIEDIKSTATDGAADAESTKSLPTLDPAELRKRALALAASDDERAMLQTWLDRPTPRGLIYEQGNSRRSVQIDDVTYKVVEEGVLKVDMKQTLSNVIFEGKEPAIVLVVGDGDGDLDLWVYDQDTNGLIGKDTDATSVCRVVWIPRYEGPFRIEVANVGSIAERYVVLVNW